VLDALARPSRARYAVYVDAVTGAPIASEQLLRFDQATMLFDAPIRAPQLGRAELPAPLLDVTIDGAPAETDAQGSLTWPVGGPGALGVTTYGAKVAVYNLAGPDATAMFNA